MGSKTTSLDSAVEEITAVAAESGTGMTAKANALSPTRDTVFTVEKRLVEWH